MAHTVISQLADIRRERHGVMPSLCLLVRDSASWVWRRSALSDSRSQRLMFRKTHLVSRELITTAFYRPREDAWLFRSSNYIISIGPSLERLEACEYKAVENPQFRTRGVGSCL